MTRETLKVWSSDDVAKPGVHVKHNASKGLCATPGHQFGAANPSDDDLARPVEDQLFFAGAASIRDSPSTVHVARLSGKRAAKQVIETCGK